METSGNEWRLLHAMLLNALVLAAAWRFVRRRGWAEDALAAMPWALLLWLAVQYASIMLPGAVGILNQWTMSAVAIACSVAMVLAARDARGIGAVEVARMDRLVCGGCIVFLGGYVAAALVHQRFIPPVADDALTYHLPAAVRWLQTGWITLHETWFFNPANTYSPLAGSAFIAWWLAPIGNDYLARFVQVPGLILIFFAMVELGRRLGAKAAAAALIALACVISRPIVSQSILAKDDLYVAGFFTCAVLALARPRASGAAWLAGISFGMLLATKITALFALPILLVMIDAPMRHGWRWRDWAIAMGLVILLAGPWFIRNAWIAGNPIFPTEISVGGRIILPGVFRVDRALGVRTVGDVWHILTGGYFSIPLVVLVILLVIWLVAFIVRSRRLGADPLVRVCMLGPWVGLIVFIAAAPFPEVRFIYPSFILLFACAAVLRTDFSMAAGAVMALTSILTAFSGELAWDLAWPAIVVSIIGILVVLMREIWPRLMHSLLIGAAAAAALAIMAACYIYMDQTIRLYADYTQTAWQMQCGAIGDAWMVVRERVQPAKTIAYANTSFTYPLFGFAGDRRVVYAPTRPDVSHLHYLPPLHAKIPGERLTEEIARWTVQDADRKAWIRNLRMLKADYLFIAKNGPVERPPELDFAANARGFELVFENSAAAVYSISRDQLPRE